MAAQKHKRWFAVAAVANTLLCFLALPPGGRPGSGATTRESAQPLKTSKASAFGCFTFHVSHLSRVQVPGLRRLCVRHGLGANVGAQKT